MLDIANACDLLPEQAIVLPFNNGNRTANGEVLPSAASKVIRHQTKTSKTGEGQTLICRGKERQRHVGEERLHPSTALGRAISLDTGAPRTNLLLRAALCTDINLQLGAGGVLLLALRQQNAVSTGNQFSGLAWQATTSIFLQSTFSF